MKTKTTRPRNPFNHKRLSPDEIEDIERFADYQGETRPRTRAECQDVPRPCPYVSCRYNLYLDVWGRGLRLQFPHLDPTEMEHSCALDEAEAHVDGMTLDEMGKRLNITRERARQLEESSLRKLRWAVYAHKDPRLMVLLEAWEVLAQKGATPWDPLG